MKQKGWINRQIAQMECEAKTWPDWMRRSDMQRPILFSRHIKAILDAEAKATPGPWEVDELLSGGVSCGISGVVTSSEDGYQAGDTWWSRTVCQTVHNLRVSGDTEQADNMRLIALSRNHIREFCEEVLRLREENDRLRNALSPFAMIGNPRDYAKRPNQLDVPFEWCEAAFRALEDGKEGK